MGSAEGVGLVKIRARTGDKTYEITVDRVDGAFRIAVDGKERLVDVRKLDADFYSIVMDDRSYEISVERDRTKYFVRHGAAERTVALTDATRRARETLAAGAGKESVAAVMPGKVVRLLVREGDAVEAGQGLVVLEAMKMENEIASPKAGTVRKIEVEPGEAVETGQELVVVE